MLVLNLLNRIFGKKPSLKRSDIDGYQEDADQQHKLEEQALSDDFDADALEGFSESALKTDAMHSLDEKIKSTYGSGGTNWGKVIALTSVIAACVVIAFILFNPSGLKEQELALNTKEEQPNEKEQIEVTNESDEEETDDVENEKEPEVVDQLDHPEETSPTRIKRPQPKALSDQVESQLDQEPVMSAEDIPDAKAENMEMLTFEPTSSIPHNSKKELKYGQAKEFYMLDFKLVDYRAYREKPIKEVRLEVSGTPAYMENDSDERSDAVFEEKEVEITYVDYLEQTLDYFQNEKYKKALQQFETILHQYEDDVNANFYAGLCAFNLENYETAQSFFKKAYSLQYGNFKEEANWFEALSLLKQNKKAPAKKMLEKIAKDNGFYAEQAKEKLKEL